MLIITTGKHICLEVFRMKQLPEYCIWIVAAIWHLYLAQCEINNLWRSTDTHFQDGAGSVLLVFLPIKVANITFMDMWNQSQVRLPKMQDQKSWTLHWRSFSGWGREYVAPVFDSQGSQYLVYGWLQLIATTVTEDAKPKIIQALLIRIFRMGLSSSSSLFCL